MCGITGWVDFTRDLRDERVTLQAMTDTMACRGPDAQGQWVAERAAIGHRRLAVIDPDGGAQPMRLYRSGDVVLTFSGEIYNFVGLRHDLQARGHKFVTRSDTEVLLHAYVQWGEDCVSRLDGMFAFAVWDEAAGQLLLARDRLGIKPLYYAELASGALFGSEPKSILAHPEFAAELDHDGVAELFAQVGTRTPGQTAYRGMHELRPGTTLRITRNGLRSRRYWQLSAQPHTDDLDTTTKTVRTLLADIVGGHLIADVPMCALLSGGLDSSALAALAAADLRDQHRGKLASFSVDFLGSQANFRPDRLRPSHDEPFAIQAAQHIDSQHTSILLTAEDLTGARWDSLYAHDLPCPGDLNVSMSLLFRRVREQSTVALSGESADEVFGGYPWYHQGALLAAGTYPWAVGGSFERLLRPEVTVGWAERCADRYADARAEVPHLPGETAPERRIREVLHLGLTRWLPMLLDRKDRLSMLHGLEVRVPFCDHRLVDYVWNVPWPIKTTGGMEKGLLRAAVSDLLPSEIVNRRKSVYPAAIGPVYQNAVRAQMEELLAQPDAPLFELIDHSLLLEAARADLTLPGLMSVQPSPTSPAAFLLEVNEWLTGYQVRLVA